MSDESEPHAWPTGENHWPPGTSLLLETMPPSAADPRVAQLASFARTTPYEHGEQCGKLKQAYASQLALDKLLSVLTEPRGVLTFDDNPRVVTCVLCGMHVRRDCLRGHVLAGHLRYEPHHCYVETCTFRSAYEDEVSTHGWNARRGHPVGQSVLFKNEQLEVLGRLIMAACELSTKEKRDAWTDEIAEMACKIEQRSEATSGPPSPPLSTVAENVVRHEKMCESEAPSAATVLAVQAVSLTNGREQAAADGGRSSEEAQFDDNVDSASTICSETVMPLTSTSRRRKYVRRMKTASTMASKRLKVKQSEPPGDTHGRGDDGDCRILESWVTKPRATRQSTAAADSSDDDLTSVAAFAHDKMRALHIPKLPGWSRTELTTVLRARSLEQVYRVERRIKREVQSDATETPSSSTQRSLSRSSSVHHSDASTPRLESAVDGARKREGTTPLKTLKKTPRASPTKKGPALSSAVGKTKKLCKRCAKSVSYPSRHALTHIANCDRFKCSECSYGATETARVRAHLNGVHAGMGSVIDNRAALVPTERAMFRECFPELAEGCYFRSRPLKEERSADGGDAAARVTMSAKPAVSSGVAERDDEDAGVACALGASIGGSTCGAVNIGFHPLAADDDGEDD